MFLIKFLKFQIPFHWHLFKILALILTEFVLKDNAKSIIQLSLNPSTFPNFMYFSIHRIHNMKLAFYASRTLT